MEQELEYLGQALEQPGAAVRRDPRRREGVGQDRGDREPARRRSTRCSSAARWPTRSSRRAACRSASRWSRTTSSTRRATSSAARRRAACGSSCRSITSSRRSSKPARRRRRSTSATRRSAIAWASTSARRRSTAYRGVIADAKTVVWNGPMGVFEIDAFADGHDRASRSAVADGARARRSSAAAIRSRRSAKAGVADRITHISTGGGASLEFLGGRTLPGVAALADK